MRARRVSWPSFSFFEAGLFVLHLLRKLSIMFLEPLADALLSSHPFQDAAVDAAVLAG